MIQVFLRKPADTQIASVDTRPRRNTFFGFNPTNWFSSKFIFELEGDKIVFNIVEETIGRVNGEVKMLAQIIVGG